MDSRTSSILINLDLKKINSKDIANKYFTSAADIKKSQESANEVKSYKTLRSTIQECYLTGSLKYGNNFIM